jgi:cell division ATPase FtsA
LSKNNSRVVEIVEQVLQKSKPMDTKTPQKLIAGIVLTGGGAQLNTSSS